MTCLLRLVGIASVVLNNAREWSTYYATINVDGASELTVDGKVGISSTAVQFVQSQGLLDRYVLRGNYYGISVFPLRAKRYEVYEGNLESLTGAASAEYYFNNVENACLKAAQHVRAQWIQSAGSVLLERVSTKELDRLRQRILSLRGLAESKYDYVQVVGGITSYINKVSTDKAIRYVKGRPKVTRLIRASTANRASKVRKPDKTRACSNNRLAGATPRSGFEEPCTPCARFKECPQKTSRVNTQRFFRSPSPKGNEDGSVIYVDDLTWQLSPEIVRSSTPFNIAVFEPCVFAQHIDTLGDYIRGLLKTSNAESYRVKVGDLATFAFQDISGIENDYLDSENWRQYYAMQCPSSALEFVPVTLRSGETYTASRKIVCNLASSGLSDVFDMRWPEGYGGAQYATRCVNIGSHNLSFTARQLASLLVSNHEHDYPLTMIDVSSSKARWRSSGMCSSYVITDSLDNVASSHTVTFVQELDTAQIGLVEWRYAADQRLDYAGGTGYAEIARYAIPEVGQR